jgi:hypothetical protein
MKEPSPKRRKLNSDPVMILLDVNIKSTLLRERFATCFVGEFVVDTNYPYILKVDETGMRAWMFPEEKFYAVTSKNFNRMDIANCLRLVSQHHAILPRSLLLSILNHRIPDNIELYAKTDGYSPYKVECKTYNDIFDLYGDSTNRIEVIKTVGFNPIHDKYGRFRVKRVFNDPCWY